MSGHRLAFGITGSLLLGIALASCSGGDDAGCGGIIEPTRTITLTPASVSIDPGTDTLITARVEGGCSTEDRTVRWSVADAGIVTVDAAGRIRGVASGSTTLIATSFGDRATARIPVTVRPRVPTTLSLAPRLDTLSPLGTRTLAATVRDQTGEPLPSAVVSFRSLTPNLATVTPAGVVSAIAAGTASIEAATARVGADSLRDTVRVLIVTACSLVRPLQTGTTTSGAIDASSCQNFQGYRAVNQYSITTASQLYLSVRLTPTGSLALVPLTIAGSAHAITVADTAVTSLVVSRPGTLNLLVTAPALTPTPFTITTQADPDPRTVCVPTDISPGVSFRTAITPTCVARDIRLVPALAIGQAVRFTGVATGFPVTLELRNAATNTLLQRAVATAAGAQATINYTNGLAAQLVRVRVSGPAGANDFVTIATVP